MPYIKSSERAGVLESGATNAGQLNYEITHAILWYKECKGLSYQTINDIRGALEGAKLEFERRVAFPYEDTKIEENGDVY